MITGACVIARLQADDQFSSGGEGFQWKALTDSLRDWKTWVGMVMYMSPDAALYAFSLFTPSVHLLL